MLCVECASPVTSLYTYYSQDNIRATTCSNCNKFADKYIEYDAVLIGIDLILLRPQAMRHLIFNVISPDSGRWTRKWTVMRTWRMHVILTLFDVYINWAHAEQSADPRMLAFIATTPPLKQYGVFLTTCTMSTAIVQALVLLLSRLLVPSSDPGAISTAVLICMGARLLPILTLIWQYDLSQTLPYLWHVIGIIMTEILAGALNFGYIRASIITSVALGARSIASEKLFTYLM